MPTYTSHYPPVQDAAHVKATSTGPDAAPWYATDPAKSLVGPSEGTAWSTPANPTPPIKFTCSTPCGIKDRFTNIKGKA